MVGVIYHFAKWTILEAISHFRVCFIFSSVFVLTHWFFQLKWRHVSWPPSSAPLLPRRKNVEWDREGAQQSLSSRLRRKCVKQQQKKKHPNYFSTTHLRPNCTPGSALSGKQGYEDRGKTFETLNEWQRTTKLEWSAETLPVVCNYGLSVQISKTVCILTTFTRVRVKISSIKHP